MFLGTSYAWFTSEVTNTANEIYVGTLKVGLYKENKDKLTGTDQPLDLADSTTGHKRFEDNVRWEPGYTNLETIKIVNEGDLAFQYVLTFTDGSIENANGVGLNDVAQYFDVWVYNHYNKQYTAPTSYEAIKNDANWVRVGNLVDVLQGKVVLSGNMVSVRKDGQDAAAINSGTTDGLSTTDEYTIALHMDEGASAKVMGRKISLSVKLVAYQKAYETDDMGTDNYDSGISVATDAESLKNALKDSKNVILASNISLANADECVSQDKAMLDGNGKSITYSGEQNANGNSVGVVTTSGGKVSNLTINGGDNGRALYVTKLASDLVVSDCTLSGAYSFNLTSTTKNDDAIISFIDTKFTSWTSYDNVANHVYFTGCEFASVLRPYGDTTLTNCTFTTAGLDVSKLEAGEAITLINCTYNGRPIEKAIITPDASSGGLHTENGIAVLDSTN